MSLLLDDIAVIEPTHRRNRYKVFTTTPATADPHDYGAPSHSARTIRRALASYEEIAAFAVPESGSLLEQALGVSAETATDEEEFAADTDHALSPADMLRLLDIVSRPTQAARVDISCDPDDYPLF
jgi:hypothetical protein